MTPIEKIICEEIAHQGPMRFQRFMEIALYQPQYGYYRNGHEKFGAQGDFITAPLLSPLFSQCIARQCQQIIAHLGSATHIIELGAGTGIMALHILKYLEQEKSLPQHYYILELSAELKMRQQRLITEHAPHLLETIEWITCLPETAIDTIILANEVMDAMPVSRFYVTENSIQEYHVDYRDGAFQWCRQPFEDPHALAMLDALNIDFPPDYTSEINLLLPSWIHHLADTVRRGVILLIDYGYTRSEYFHPQRYMGTLMCHSRHRAHDNPLIDVGLQDITAHVDFSAVAEAAVSSGLDVSGFIHQAGFLINCGLLQHADTQQYDIAQQVRRLTHPAEMGERFHAIALTKNCDIPLIGFDQFDQMHRL